MRKGKVNYEDELYEDDDYYDEDDDYYEDEEYEEEEEKPKKATSKKQNSNNNQNKTNKQANNKQQNQNTIKPAQNKPSNNQKQNATISNQNTENSSQKTNKPNENKELKEITELNKLIYPKIEYGSKYAPSEDEKDPLNLVIIGHVDSGKSTLIGHLLTLLNKVDKKNPHKKNKKKSSKEPNSHNEPTYAFITDEATDEQEHGVTIDIAYKTFTTNKKFVTALDAPGHRDFIPNMIAGTSAADAALLVIDSGKQAFDAGFFREGQTREHALLAKTLGITQMIIAVNKLELFDWQESRYNEICEELKKYLIDDLDFKENNLFFIPVSGLLGENLISKIKSENANWYKGPNLVELIDKIESPQRAINAPVRFIISDISTNNVNGPQGVNIFGKLESGIIDLKSEYMIMPIGNKYKLKNINVNKKNVDFVSPGLQAELKLNISKNAKEECIIEPGDVLCSEKYSIPVIKMFKAHVKTCDIKIPISLGQKMMFYLQGQKTQITIKKIEKIFNEGSVISKNNTRFIPKNFYANIVIDCEKTICGELFSNSKKLSTFTLRIGGETQAIGYITEFLK